MTEPDLHIPFRKRLRLRVETAFALTVMGVLRRLPVEWASAAGGFILRNLARFTTRHRRAIANLQRIFPDMPEKTRRHMALRHWDNMGRNIAELPHLETISTDPERLRISGEKALKKLETLSGGAVIVSAHFGNWELGPAVTRRYNRDLAAYYRPLNNTRLDEELLKLRAPLLGDGEMIPKGGQGLRRGLQALRQGRWVLMLADLREDMGITMPFLGHPANTNTAPALMALRHDVPLFCALTRRLPSARFHVEVREIDTRATGDMKRDQEILMSRIHDMYEDFILEYPDQWLWSHRRWND